MQVNNPPENRQNTVSNNKKIILIICIYIFLIMSSRFTPVSNSINTATIKDRVINPGSIISLAEVLNIYPGDQIYQGNWKKQNRDGAQLPSYLTEIQGKFKMYIDRQATYTYPQALLFRLQFQILDGHYIDKGALYFDLFLENDKFAFQRISNTSVRVYYNNSNGQLTATFRKDQILITDKQGQMNITSLDFTLSVANNNIDVALSIEAFDQTLAFTVTETESKVFVTMLFAGVMLFCAYMSFIAIMTILKSIYELQDNPRKYSFFTIMLTNMWDAVLCIVCFIFAFKDQESLILFIIPAFFLCLLFTNLQPRLMIAIYQNMTGNNFNIRQILCRFNLFHYGSLFSIYPILLLTNFNWILFVGMSCILFPQIYVNGFINIRPDVTSSYYLKYLLSRFVLIAYLKCFPYNVFSFKPDYILGAICLSLILIQFGLLYVQKIYGSKKVLPNFLLQPVFDYKLEEQFNIEQGTDNGECSICLTTLNTEPPQNPNQLQFEPNFKLMKTPCNHRYHSHCLMVWMKIKMECPQCRFKLPPYE